MIAGLRKVQGRVVRALELSIDDLIERHFPTVRTTDPGKRVAELRKLSSTKLFLFTRSKWVFQGALDLHVESGNLIRHCRPKATDHVAVTEVAKALMAVKTFGSAHASATLQGQLFFIVAYLRSLMPVAVPAGVTPVKYKMRHVKALGDIPPAPVDAVWGIVNPVLYKTAEILREFLGWICIPVHPSDDFSMMLEKMEKAHLRESRTHTGVPMHHLPIQQLFMVEEGRTVVGTARSARMALSAAQNWSASVRLEDALLPLAAALSTARLLWEGAADGRKRKTVSFITRAIDDIVAVYFAKVVVVNFRDESYPLASCDAEADLEGEATQVGGDETRKEGDEDEAATEFTKGDGERTEAAVDDTGEGLGGEDPEIVHAKGEGDGTEGGASGSGEKGGKDAATEDAKGEGTEFVLAEKPGKRNGDGRAENDRTSVSTADGSTDGKPKLTDAVQQLMALKTSGGITAVELGRLVKIFADNDLYIEGLCALESDTAAQIAFVQYLLPGPQ